MPPIDVGEAQKHQQGGGDFQSWRSSVDHSGGPGGGISPRSARGTGVSPRGTGAPTSGRRAKQDPARDPPAFQESEAEWELSKQKLLEMMNT